MRGTSRHYAEPELSRVELEETVAGVHRSVCRDRTSGLCGILSCIRKPS